MVGTSCGATPELRSQRLMNIFTPPSAPAIMNEATTRLSKKRLLLKSLSLPGNAQLYGSGRSLCAAERQFHVRMRIDAARITSIPAASIVLSASFRRNQPSLLLLS